MKYIKLFEEFSGNILDEGMMSEIDIIGQEAQTVTEFNIQVKKFLKTHAAKPEVAEDDDFIQKMADEYFDEAGNKLVPISQE